MNVFITGAGRGIGLGFVVHYLSLRHTVYACYRSDSDELAALAEKHHDLNIVQWDVTLPATEHFLQTLPEKIDLVINGLKSVSQSTSTTFEYSWPCKH